MILSRFSLIARYQNVGIARFLCNKSPNDDLSKNVKPDKNKQKNEATSKLNNLLQQILHDDKENKMKLSLARPKGREASKAAKEKPETYDQKMSSAVKDVAGAFGGNSTQIESELLNMLQNGASDKPKHNLTDIVKGMKIEKADQSSRAHQVRKSMESKPKEQRWQRRISTPSALDMNQAETINIFDGDKLGVFDVAVKDFPPVTTKMCSTWEKLAQRELKLAVTHPPANYFQEQILWTEQGKIWKFPIDNEQGMDEERSVHFADHVFLEEYLEPWCPSKGPLRHFMELVCVGLSKNAYMSVKDKREHIKWYENYFESKKDLLKEVGALPAEDIAPKQLHSE